MLISPEETANFSKELYNKTILRIFFKENVHIHSVCMTLSNFQSENRITNVNLYSFIIIQLIIISLISTILSLKIIKKEFYNRARHSPSECGFDPTSFAQSF